MKVCLISREFAPFFGAGIGTYAACWARALTEAGCDVHVLTRNHEGVLQQGPNLFPGVTFHVVDPADGPPKLDHNYPYARHALAVLKTIRRLHERFGFDVEFLYVARLRGLRLKEIAVRWDNDDRSKVNVIRDSIRMFDEVRQIRRNAKNGVYEK